MLLHSKAMLGRLFQGQTGGFTPLSLKMLAVLCECSALPLLQGKPSSGQHLVCIRHLPAVYSNLLVQMLALA